MHKPTHRPHPNPLAAAIWLALLSSPTTHAQTTPEPSPAPEATPAARQRIEVSGARFREQAGKSSLSGEELARVPGSGGDPMRAIQSLPGVASVDDTSSDPAVRGSRPSDNAYFVDFLPVGYLFHAGGLASVFNPGLIQRFSLSSAAWSPAYGDAVGAVFDIQLRSPRQDRLGGRLDFSLLGANVLAEGPIGEQLSFFIAGRRSWFDVVMKGGEDKEEGVSFTTPVYSDSQGRLLWTLNPRNRVRLDFATANDRSTFDVKAGGKTAEREPILVGQSNERQSFATAAVVWESEFSDSLAYRVALGHMKQDFSFRFGGAGNVKVGFGTSYLRQELAINRWAAHEIVLGATAQSRLIDAKLDFNYPRCTEFDPNCDINSAPRLLTSQRARQNAAALYFNDRWRFAPRWAASFGLRASRDAYIDANRVEPRVALEYEPSRATTWSLAAGSHSQPPAGEESLAVIGNPRLKPVTSEHLAAGLTQRLADGWSLKTELYAKRFNGYAVADPVLNYRNGARGRAEGIELLLKRDAVPGSKLSGFASLTLSRSRRTVDATGETFPFDYDQPVIATVVGNYEHSPRWRYGLKWSYHSGSPYTPVVGTGRFPDGRVRPVYGRINSERVPAYHRLDLRADWRWTPGLEIYFELINAYARKNIAGYSYSADYKTREEIRQLPLLPSVGLTYMF